MPKRLSAELRERLKKKQENHPLPANYFVCLHWPQSKGHANVITKCYSTFEHPVTVNGTAYTGKSVLLDVDGESNEGFVWSSDDLYYGGVVLFQSF